MPLREGEGAAAAAAATAFSQGNSALKAKSKWYSSKATKTRENLDCLEAGVSRATGEIAGLKVSVEDAQRKKVRLTTQLENARQESSRLSAEGQRLKNSLADALAERDQHNTQLAGIEDVLRAGRSATSEVERRLSLLREKKAALGLATATLSVASTSSALPLATAATQAAAIAEHSNSSLQREEMEQTTSNALYSREKAAMEAEIASAKKMMQELRSQSEKLKEPLETMKVQLFGVTSTNYGLSQREESLRSRLREKKAARETAEMEQQAILTEIRWQQSRIDGLGRNTGSHIGLAKSHFSKTARNQHIAEVEHSERTTELIHFAEAHAKVIMNGFQGGTPMFNLTNLQEAASISNQRKFAQMSTPRMSTPRTGDRPRSLGVAGQLLLTS